MIYVKALLVPFGVALLFVAEGFGWQYCPGVVIIINASAILIACYIAGLDLFK